ncbi:hypothetical protein ACFSO0_15190 [Brevibacillus sp. GCM10020057]|uniref:hypothetical protein n=1 Tax=Brevibacillus sp. GCM10020057 TaxID=3317327 RepID=UPI003639DE60
MFSPSQLIQSLVQRAPVPAQKPVELTPGQVFKGTVVKQLPDNMALVQIGGLQVQAKLEAKLEQGQKAWLQVQPQTDVVTLKVLDTPVEGPGKEASLEGLIRSLGLAETKESKVIVSALMNANLPINKETVQAFAAVAARLGVDDATVEAFMMAVKRNLPLTPDTVAGLKAFLGEKPISQAIQNFVQQAAQFLAQDAEGEGQARATVVTSQPGQAGGAGAATSQPAQASGAGAATNQPGQANGAVVTSQPGQAGGALRQLVSALQEKVAALPLTFAPSAEAGQTAALVAANQADGSRTVAAADGQVEARGGNVANAPAGSQLPSGASVPTAPGLPAGKPPAGGVEGQPVGSAVTQQNQQQLPAGKGIADSAPMPAGSASTPNPGTNQGTAGFADVARAEGGMPQQSATPAGAGKSGQHLADMPPVRAETTDAMTPASAGTLRHGTEEAPQAAPPANFPTQSATNPGSHPIQTLLRQLGIAHERELMGQALSGGAPEAGLHKQMESVKSLLLQITQSQSQHLPAALREAADQLLQHVTGQQLMLMPQANQVFSQVVMQIPIRAGSGEETAYVQIESKKKDGGQVDAENCRLFFHLELQKMGTTMIDVSIVNRIINLQIFTNTPWVEGLVQGMKEGFAGQLQEVGYHLSAVRVRSIPEQRTKNSVAPGAKGAIFADYKGVDLRI